MAKSKENKPTSKGKQRKPTGIGRNSKQDKKPKSNNSKKEHKSTKSSSASLLNPSEDQLSSDSPLKVVKKKKGSISSTDKNSKKNTTNANSKKNSKLITNNKANDQKKSTKNGKDTKKRRLKKIDEPVSENDDSNGKDTSTAIRVAFMTSIPKAVSSVPLVKATTEFVTRMCLSKEEKDDNVYYERSEFYARKKQREDFKLRMQHIRNSLKRATRKHRKVLKARMKEIKQNQEMVMGINDKTNGKLIMGSVYGSPRNGISGSPRGGSPRSGFGTARSPRTDDVSAMIMMGGHIQEKRRPASRQRLAKMESNFFSIQGGKDKKKKTMVPSAIMHGRIPAKVRSETGEDFDEFLGSPVKKRRAKEEAISAKRKNLGNSEKKPYFVAYMAMTEEERKGRLLWKKDYDRQIKLKKLAEEIRENPSTDIPEKIPEPISHVGRRVWDYSGVPRLDNTTAKRGSSSEETDSDDDDETSANYSDVSSTQQYEKPERKNDPELLREIFPRPGAVDLRTWTKYGMRFHQLPKEQQQRAIKREKQMYLLERADRCYEIIERGIKTLEDYRENSGIKEVKKAASVMQNILDHLIGLKISAQNMNDEEMAEVSGEYCGKLYAARTDNKEIIDERDNDSKLKIGRNGSGEITDSVENSDTDENSDTAGSGESSNNSSRATTPSNQKEGSHQDVNILLDDFSMAITEGLASNEPAKIDFDQLNERLKEIKNRLDGKGIQSAMGKRHLGLANLTATFAVQRQDLEKNATKYQLQAKELEVEIDYENKMDRERMKEIKKRNRTPYLSGKREYKPKPIKCWVCKEILDFSVPQGHMFTFCSSKDGCGALNQNVRICLYCVYIISTVYYIYILCVFI
jgi:hypothetical protein